MRRRAQPCRVCMAIQPMRLVRVVPSVLTSAPTALRRLPTFIQPEQRVKVVPPGSQPFGNTTAGAGAGSAAVSGVVVAAAAGEGGASRTAAG